MKAARSMQLAAGSVVAALALTLLVPSSALAQDRLPPIPAESRPRRRRKPPPSSSPSACRRCSARSCRSAAARS